MCLQKNSRRDTATTAWGEVRETQLSSFSFKYDLLTLSKLALIYIFIEVVSEIIFRYVRRGKISIIGLFEIIFPCIIFKICY